jgi:hypothetical protein
LNSTALLMLALGGCHRSPAPRFTAPQKLGGVEVSAEVLNAGYAGYTPTCRACPGDAGEGGGPAALGLRPPPASRWQARQVWV